ncbi:MAG: hypothetical protein LKJ25_04155 [Clostridia bacterium]|jgi:transposase|nr:hypothetical protein [Clostridia bacterium]
MARAGKYKRWLTEEGLLLLSGWSRDGLTDAEIAKNIGISRKTLLEWKKKFSAIGDTIKKGKEYADRKVENSLYKRACGYNAKYMKNFKIRHVKYDEKTGRKIAEDEEIVQREEETHIPADVLAIIYWLKNRKPDTWRDKPMPKGNENDINIVEIPTVESGEEYE